MQAYGGLPPYNYRLLTGTGKLYADQALYRVGIRSETATVEVTDQSGQMKIVTVKTKPAPKPDKIISLRNLNFVFDTATLIESSEADIMQIIQTLKTMKIKRLIIEGHTDSFGADEYNVDLSERRAQTIAAILVRELGLAAEAVQPVGFGESRPMAGNQTPIGRQLNRRVDIKVYFVSN
jgi:OmpA-OmpF porin, OOP family